MRRIFLCLPVVLAVVSFPALAKSPDQTVQKPVPKPSSAEEEAAEKAFKAGIALTAKGMHAEALVQFQKVLKVAPDDPAVLWNAASAAQQSNNFKLAAMYYERDQKFEPNNGQLLAKLVQTYQALGDTAKRDVYRQRVFAMHKSGKDESGYLKREQYCRDQFVLNGDQVFVFEQFDLKPRVSKDDLHFFGVRYEFLVFAPKSPEEPKIRLEVGWSNLDPDGKGGFLPGKELNGFYFDAYYSTGEWSRKTYGLFQDELPYDAVRARFLDIINGKVEMTGGRKRNATGPGD